MMEQRELEQKDAKRVGKSLHRLGQTAALLVDGLTGGKRMKIKIEFTLAD